MPAPSHDQTVEVLPPPTLQEFCQEVCCGHAPAMDFCHLWFTYCHAIDDLIDGLERPSPEALLTVFIQANVLFSSEFYVRHLRSLQPVVLLVTNAYADSVAWERSSVPYQFTIADVIRCCGNEMFFMVAMICGGWPHARSLSARIRDQSWRLQHEPEPAKD